MKAVLIFLIASQMLSWQGRFTSALAQELHFNPKGTQVWITKMDGQITSRI